MASPLLQQAPRPSREKGARLAGRPRGLTEAQCRELMHRHIRFGEGPAELATHFNVPAAVLRRTLNQPYLQALGAEIVARADRALASMLLVMRGAGLKAAENISNAVDQGDLAQSQFVLNWHSKLLPQQVQVTGSVDHNHTAVGQLGEAVGRLTDLLSTRSPIPMSPFIFKGSELAAEHNPLPPTIDVEAKEVGSTTFTPNLDSTPAPAQQATQPTDPIGSNPHLKRRADGTYLLGK